jgi:hypothetical protein
MKRNLALVLLALFSFLIVLPAGAGQLGAPEPIANDSSVSLGVGYSFLSSKVQFQGSDKFTLDQHQVYGQLSAAYRNAEGYLRVGGSTMRLKDAFATSLPGVTLAGFKNEFEDDSSRAFLAAGAKYKFDISKYISIGPSVQVSIFDEYKDQTTGMVNGIPITQSLEISGAYRFDGAAFLQLNLRPVHLYAGPFIYWIRSDVESTSLRVSGDKMQESGNFGGAGGIRIKLPMGLNIEIEGQYAERFSAGGLISYAF